MCRLSLAHVYERMGHCGGSIKPQKKGRHQRCGRPCSSDNLPSSPRSKFGSRVDFPGSGAYTHVLIANHGRDSPQARERRSKPRINKPFQAEAYGVASDGSTFEVGTALKNMSSSGLYFCMTPGVEI